ncbi:MAG: hypothetical protein ACLTZY_00440 [Alistipes indistinctus]
MTGAYLIDPSTGKLNPNAELLYWDPWDGHFLQNRFRQEYNVSVSGATDKTDYFISAGYLEDPLTFRDRSSTATTSAATSTRRSPNG